MALAQKDPLAGCMLLAPLGEADRSRLMEKARPVHYPPGTLIFGRSDPGETLLFIETGRVEISVTSLNGRRSVLNHMGPGEALGEIAMLDGGLRSADASAATDVTGRLLHRSDVFAFLRERPDAMLGLVQELCAKVRNASEMFSAQSQTDASARLARCLLRLSEKWGEPDPSGVTRIGASFSQSDLGDFAGLSRENVNRRLRQWADDGLIALCEDGLTILDQDGLSEIAQL